VENNITSSGDNLNVFIARSESIHEGWMSYACWYSLKRFLPDAQVYLLPNKKLNPYICYWAYSRGVKAQSPDANALIVSSDMMMVRSFTTKNLKDLRTYFQENAPCFLDQTNLCSSCQNTEAVPFIHYAECGKFNKKEWIKKERRDPFAIAHQFYTP